MEGACGDAVEIQSATEIDKVSAGSCAGQRVSMKSMPLTVANFRTLHVHMRVRQPRDTNFMFLAFDLLPHLDGIDLKVLALSQRKPDLARHATRRSYPSSAQCSSRGHSQ
jgi:hypothetical protein